MGTGIDIEPGAQETNEQIEQFIIDLDLPFEELQEGMWVIHDEVDYIDNIVLYHNSPVLTFRVKLMDAPQKDVEPELYRRLLELNATSMVAGAFGLEEEAVVFIESLHSETLTQREFQASFDALTLAIREHYGDLKSFIDTSNDRENDEQQERAVGATD